MTDGNTYTRNSRILRWDNNDLRKLVERNYEMDFRVTMDEF